MIDNYYNFHIKRVKDTLNIIDPYINNIKSVINIGYSSFDAYIKDYFKNSEIFYLIPEYIENKYGNEYIKGDICNINFKIDKKYDLVIFTEVLEHLFCNDDIIIKNIKSMLNKHGLLLISVPNALTLSNRLKVILGKNIYWNKNDIINGVYGGYGHIREYSAKEIKNLIEKYFKIINIKGINGYRKGIKKILNIFPYTYSNTIAILGENYD